MKALRLIFFSSLSAKDDFFLFPTVERLPPFQKRRSLILPFFPLSLNSADPPFFARPLFGTGHFPSSDNGPLFPYFFSPFPSLLPWREEADPFPLSVIMEESHDPLPRDFRIYLFPFPPLPPLFSLLEKSNCQEVDS